MRWRCGYVCVADLRDASSITTRSNFLCVSSRLKSKDKCVPVVIAEVLTVCSVLPNVTVVFCIPKCESCILYSGMLQGHSVFQMLVMHTVFGNVRGAFCIPTCNPMNHRPLCMDVGGVAEGVLCNLSEGRYS